MEQIELQRIVESILFAAGERVEISRLAAVLEIDENEIISAVDALADELAFNRRGIRILRLENGYQMVSSGEMADYVTKALETRKPPKLSSSQLETLTIIAYYQPATKAMVEQIRGVDSAYSVGALLNKKLIEDAGRLNVPGRPIQYKTTPDFLRTFALNSLEDLPNYNELLDRIRVIHSDGESLYREFKIPDEESDEVCEKCGSKRKIAILYL